MVFRCFSEKKPGFDIEAQGLLHDLRTVLELTSIDGLRIVNRYDVEGVDAETYEAAKRVVFSEPPCDDCYDEIFPFPESCRLLAVGALPGQFDQRADSCAQCIQLLAGGERPVVAAAKIYIITGEISNDRFDRLRTYLINPVESREAPLDKPETLASSYPEAPPVPDIDGFCSLDEAGLKALLDEYELAMDIDDLTFMRDWFAAHEGRDPTETELRVVDTYWSDHCRHTTFLTHIDNVEITDISVADAYSRYLELRREVYGSAADTRPQTLMDIGTIGAKALKKRGLKPEIDESEEVNACSIRIPVNVDDGSEDWLLMFKNETHNHPTEVEPFGGAATCIGGAIRDPLSGRAYVYQAMRVTGSGDPRAPVEDTLPGKLPQRKLTMTAAAGYSSYGNQIGLATGLVHEFYHPGYVAKRMEVGAVVGAVRASDVVRRRPAPGDKVILLGGRTGRDGCGGATGSSKTHNLSSLEAMATEVQKGNAPEERKIQRLFRRRHVSRMILRCNDFGAGGVSVAIGELADGLDIELGNVRKKYEGLGGTELAISESQERMAIVVSSGDVEAFIAAAQEENLEAYVVAEVTENPRMVMRLNGKIIADLPREFLSTNGADKHTRVKVLEFTPHRLGAPEGDFADKMLALMSDINVSSQRGLVERFDATVGAASVLMPFGGENQLSPSQSMAALLPVPAGETDTCSVMAFGFNPFVSSANPYEGAKLAVTESIAKLIASGCEPGRIYLSFQEYFERLRGDETRWGKPFSALLGALDAQMAYGVAAIGGKDSMSGSFLDMDVPPTLISFAVAPCEAGRVVSTEFKAPDSPVYLFTTDGSLEKNRELWERFSSLAGEGRVRAAWAVTNGGIAEGVFKMSLGNSIGFEFAPGFSLDAMFVSAPGTIIAECIGEVEGAPLLGRTIGEPLISYGNQAVDIGTLRSRWEAVLEPVFPTKTGDSGRVPAVTAPRTAPLVCSGRIARPRAVIPVFPGTNCELDTARALESAGAKAETVVIQNLSSAMLETSADELARAIEASQMLVIPGGFSGGDEPEGSGKFIAAFFRNPRIRDATHELLKTRDGLMLGVCNGFQALIKLGLVPYGEIRDIEPDFPTLTFNSIGRHQSRYVTTRISSVNSPWLQKCAPGELHSIAVSHGEGRFVASEELMRSLIKNGQLATQYCDPEGNPSMDISVNPNGSQLAVEGILSPDGRVFGKMGHTERYGKHLAKNITGEKYQPIFASGVSYYR